MICASQVNCSIYSHQPVYHLERYQLTSSNFIELHHLELPILHSQTISYNSTLIKNCRTKKYVGLMSNLSSILFPRNQQPRLEHFPTKRRKIFGWNIRPQSIIPSSKANYLRLYLTAFGPAGIFPAQCYCT